MFKFKLNELQWLYVMVFATVVAFASVLMPEFSYVHNWISQEVSFFFTVAAAVLYVLVYAYGWSFFPAKFDDRKSVWEMANLLPDEKVWFLFAGQASVVLVCLTLYTGNIAFIGAGSTLLLLALVFKFGIICLQAVEGSSVSIDEVKLAEEKSDGRH